MINAFAKAMHQELIKKVKINLAGRMIWVLGRRLRWSGVRKVLTIDSNWTLSLLQEGKAKQNNPEKTMLIWKSNLQNRSPSSPKVKLHTYNGLYETIKIIDLCNEKYVKIKSLGGKAEENWENHQAKWETTNCLKFT